MSLLAHLFASYILPQIGPMSKPEIKVIEMSLNLLVYLNLEYENILHYNTNKNIYLETNLISPNEK